MVDYICIDVASAPIPDAADFIEVGDPPENYSKPESIEKWRAERHAKLLAKAALDLDLSRLTAVGLSAPGLSRDVYLCSDEAGEEAALAMVGDLLAPANAVAVTFNGRSFDLALLQRRALYLGCPFPRLDLFKYKSPHVDLCELLSAHEPQRRHSLDFYCKRLGWTDLDPKPMEAAEEAQVFEHNDWQRLEASVRRDVTAIRRLAIWAGVIPAEEE